MGTRSFVRIKRVLCLSIVSVLLVGISAPPVGAQSDQVNNARGTDAQAIFGDHTAYEDNETACTPSGGPTSGNLPPGSKVYILGDSITARSANTYQTKFKENNIEATISARVGRSWTGPGQEDSFNTGSQGTGQQAAAQDKAAIAAADGIIIALGTNQFDTQNPINSIIDTIRSDGYNKTAPIWWVNIANAAGPVKAYNDALNAQASAGRIKIINWAGVVDPGGDGTKNPKGLLDDGTHPKIPEGVTALVDLVMGETTKQSTTPSTPTTTPTDTSALSEGFNPDPAAVEQFNKELKPLIDPLIPLYQKAAKDAGLADWQILPALHNLEFGLRRDNPTSNLGFKSPFQMSASGLSSNGVDPNGPIFSPGKTLSDEEFVTVATYSAKFWLLNDAKFLKIDATKPVTAAEAGKMIAAYKSGAGSVWFTGAADFNLHAYAWAGFDTTPAHKLPMAWGPGSPYGDEVAGTRVSKVGAATLFMLLRGAAPGGGGCEETTVSGGTLKPVTGTKQELADRLVNNSNVKFGNLGADVIPGQKQDIASCLTDNMLAAFVAIAEQSGSSIIINALASDHGGCGGSGSSLHNQGRAIDIGYFGYGKANNNEEGNRLYKFMFDNWQGLNIEELIWQEPAPNTQCVGKSGPTNCYAYYSKGIMDQHYHHIHMGVKQ